MGAQIGTKGEAVEFCHTNGIQSIAFSRLFEVFTGFVPRI